MKTIKQLILGAFVIFSVAKLWAGPLPAYIRTQPLNQTVLVGVSATFSVVALGDGPISYQWQRSVDAGGSFSNLVNANAPTFTSSNNPFSASGYLFRCVVSNSTGSAVSSWGILVVNTVAIPPGGIQAGLGEIVNPGDTAFFIVTPTGNDPFSYQWSRSNDSGSTWTNIPGANAASYSFAAAPTDNNSKFRCTVSNSAGSAVSGIRTLWVTGTTTNITTPPPPTQTPLTSIASPSINTARLSQNGTISIIHRSDIAGSIRARIMDRFGREIKGVVDGNFTAGDLSMDWDLRNSNGSKVEPGVYYMVIEDSSKKSFEKLVIRP